MKLLAKILGWLLLVVGVFMTSSQVALLYVFGARGGDAYLFLGISIALVLGGLAMARPSKDKVGDGTAAAAPEGANIENLTPGTPHAATALNDNILRGGFGEPYCSKGCYDEAGRAMGKARVTGACGDCEYCKKIVSEPEVVLVKGGRLVFICGSCASAAQVKIKLLSECSFCGASAIKPIEAPQAKNFPAIEARHLASDFVGLDSSPGQGGAFFQDAIQHWNQKDFDAAFDRMQSAISAGLSPTYESYAHTVLGNILIERTDLSAAVTQYLTCLAEQNKTDQAAWEAAVRLAVIYNEAGQRVDAGKLERVADKANTRNLALEGAHEQHLRSLVRKHIAA